MLDNIIQPASLVEVANGLLHHLIQNIISYLKIVVLDTLICFPIARMLPHLAIYEGLQPLYPLLQMKYGSALLQSFAHTL
jgi:hypothetical protein